jgi:hypothetical protein
LEELSVGKEEPQYRHGRNRDPLLHLVDVTKKDRVEDSTAHQKGRHEPLGVPSPLFSIDDLDYLIKFFF